MPDESMISERDMAEQVALANEVIDEIIAEERAAKAEEDRVRKALKSGRRSASGSNDGVGIGRVVRRGL